jgi:hypothetical protein
MGGVVLNFRAAIALTHVACRMWRNASMRCGYKSGRFDLRQLKSGVSSVACNHVALHHARCGHHPISLKEHHAKNIDCL